MEGGTLEDLEVLVMGSQVRGEERPGAGKKKYCDGKHLKQAGMFLVLSIYLFSGQLGNGRDSIHLGWFLGEGGAFFYSLYS